jgi:hypothetical protein
VERTFASINTLFCQYVAGYTGRDVTRRGADVDQRSVWPIADLQDLLDEWVIACWQRRPHDGLRHPEVPRSALSPNEMYAALVASAGYLPLALSGENYLELLPVAWRRITAEGIRLGYLTYDSDVLNPMRGQPSGVLAKSGRWEVHYDPYDLSRVWVRTREDGWITVAWIHHQRGSAPFADYTLRHVRRLLVSRGEDQGQDAIARALDDLLTRAGNGPAPVPLASRRITARTRAATANPLRPVDPSSEDIDEDSAGTESNHAPEVASDADAGGVVIPFGVFDAHKEAERFW